MAAAPRPDRSDPAAARAVIRAAFGKTPRSPERTFVTFFSRDIEFLALRYNDQWGVTLFDWGVRLNVGGVECLVLHNGGLRVLLDKDVAPAKAPWSGREYKLAPGCRMAAVPFAQLVAALPSLKESHHAALMKAAKRATTPSIRNAHSTGVVGWLSQTVGRFLSNPSYIADEQEELAATLYFEGGRIAALVNRFERDARARKVCIAHHGIDCSVCGMSFGERYGQTMKGVIHVHHLVPLSSVGATYEVDPIEDLRPVCPNCHLVIHSVNPPLSIQQARALLSLAKQPTPIPARYPRKSSA